MDELHHVASVSANAEISHVFQACYGRGRKAGGLYESLVLKSGVRCAMRLGFSRSQVSQIELILYEWVP